MADRALPYVGRVYEPNDRLSDLIRYRGESRANAELNRGAASASMIGSIGQGIGGALSQLAQYQQEAPEREAREARAALMREQLADSRAVKDVMSKTPTDPATGRMDPAAVAKEVQLINPELAMQFWQTADAEKVAQLADDKRKVGDLAQKVGALRIATMKVAPPLRQEIYSQARNDAIQSGLVKPEQIPERYDPGWLERKHTEFMTAAQQIDAIEKLGAAPKTRQIEVKNPDGSTSIQIVEDTPGQTFTSAAENKRHMVTVPGPDGRPVQRLATEDELAQGVTAYRAPVAGPGPEPLVAVMGDDGEPVLMPRSQAVGRRPASNREQGRPVTSGDAGRITELDTSLDDLKALRSTLTETADATGTMATAGAMLPNAVTEFTGWGSDAKQRQGVIDRVKQVIGKALEDGVLRKEDEYKYTKILPTISDPPELAMSKLDGLEAALKLRRERTLESLSDAGFDTSKFIERSGTNAITGKPEVTAMPPSPGATKANPFRKP